VVITVLEIVEDTDMVTVEGNCVENRT